MNHIEIKQDQDCCGCGACVAACPEYCITMQPNREGFLYPHVNQEKCTECGKCLSTCPWGNIPKISNRIAPSNVFAAWHLDEGIRRLSSSGGVFSALAEDILAHDGIVVGAAFDEHLVCRHIIIKDINELSRLRGSKYVQSQISSDIFYSLRQALDEGRFVLFTGSPCQVAGLRNVLGRDYENLFCCDFICHGVPSPQFFRKHIESLHKPGNPLISFSFRDKTHGWKRSSVRKTWANGKTLLESIQSDTYMAAFRKNLSLRESCYSCKYATTIRQGDLTIADFWKVASKYPEYDTDDKGTSLILVNTDKGAHWLDHCLQSLFIGKANLEHAITGNRGLQAPAERPACRNTFYFDTERKSMRRLRSKYHIYHKKTIWRRILDRLRRTVMRGMRKSEMSQK